jgi:hypothetical protein
LVAVINGLGSPEKCQAECLKLPDCNYFSWVR